jgi:hypothetical protein
MLAAGSDVVSPAEPIMTSPHAMTMAHPGPCVGAASLLAALVRESSWPAP